MLIGTYDSVGFGRPAILQINAEGFVHNSHTV